jgi:hypothetical protein
MSEVIAFKDWAAICDALGRGLLGSVTDVEHPALGKSFRYATSKWIGTATGWTPGRRAPRLNEDAATVNRPIPRGAPAIEPKASVANAGKASSRGRPFALDGIRVLDFTWFLASAGGTRFLSSFGAECLKVELKSHLDTRLAAMAKRLATDAGFEVVNGCLQLHGGYGYLRDHPIERVLRDVRVHQILEGTNEVMRLIVSRDMLGN